MLQTHLPPSFLLCGTTSPSYQFSLQSVFELSHLFTVGQFTSLLCLCLTGPPQPSTRRASLNEVGSGDSPASDALVGSPPAFPHLPSSARLCPPLPACHIHPALTLAMQVREYHCFFLFRFFAFVFFSNTRSFFSCWPVLDAILKIFSSLLTVLFTFFSLPSYLRKL